MLHTGDRYQLWLEWIGALLMSLFMILFAASILIAPNIDLFTRVGNYLGIHLNPLFFAILSVIGAIFSPFIPRLKTFDMPTRNSLFALCSSSLMFYTIGVAFYLIATNGNSLTIAIYLATLLLVVLVGAAIYRTGSEYQKRIEYASAVLLFSIMIIAAWSFIYHPNAAIFALASHDFGYPVTSPMVGLFASAGAIGFLLSLIRPVQHLSILIRRLWYAACASPIILYLIPLAYQMLQTHSGISFSVMIVLVGFIGLLGLAIVRK